MKRVSILLLVAIALIYIFFFSISFNQAECTYLIDFKKLKFSGIIINKFIDSSEHSYPLIIVKDTDVRENITINLVYDTTKTFNILNIGDSIKKEFGSLYIQKKVGSKYIKLARIDFGCDKY